MKSNKAVKVIGLAVCTALCLAVTAGPASADKDFAKYAIESVSAELSTKQAGAHADLTTSFELNATEELKPKPYAFTRDIAFHLPPGVIGNPQRFQRCTVGELGKQPVESECPQDAQVGVTEVRLAGDINATLTEPIYNMTSPGGEIVARFGFFAGFYPTIVNVRVNPIDYSLEAAVEGASAAAEVIAADTTLWGVPAAESHDELRLTPGEALEEELPPEGRKSGQPEVPFLSNPTDCTLARQVAVTVTSYQEPNTPKSKSASFPAIGGCDKLVFKPSITLTPTNPEAFAPTGVDATVTIPQDETAKGLASSTLKGAVVSLPQGMSINPAAGDGLEACSAEQVGFETTNTSNCPDAAKIGSAELEVPALESTLHGSVYQRTPEPGKLFRFWLVTDEQGVHLKLPAEITTDPITGQVTTVFNGIPSLGGNPQVPVEQIRLHVFGGPRAPLATPGCGSYQSHYEFTPWSGKPATVGDTAMQITTGCNKGGFSPQLQAGSLSNRAGAFTPFTLTLTRSDGEANPRTLSVHLPEGLLAKLAGVPLCPEASAQSASCPASSQVGRLTAATGVGGAPLWIPQPGKAPTAIYLAGPYKGAPYSIISRVPAQAGPFDLGVVVNRAAIAIDPNDATATVTTDPLPQILEGVPLAYRTINATVDRAGFTFNPTGCTEKQISATVVATSGAVANPKDGFQATNCASLGFEPKLELKLKGGTKRNSNPALTATVKARPGDANIGAAKVTLPHSAFLDQSHIKTVCTRVQFNAGAGNGASCPAASVYGKAEAKTPLLDEALKGPVYLRSSSHPLPDMVVALHSGKIDINLVGRIDTGKGGGIRSSFESVPDAPVTSFTLQMAGGKKGLIVNSTNLCASTNRAVAEFTGQNGKAREFRPVVKPTGCKGKKARKGAKGRGAR